MCRVVEVHSMSQSIDVDGPEPTPDVPTERQDGTLSRDDVFDVLYNERRRDVLDYLRDNGGEATVSDLAEYIAAMENDTTVQQLSSSERKCVYVGLYQNHLPMMDDVGVVDYDKNRGTVELRDCMPQLRPYLDEAADSADEPLRIAWPVGLAVVMVLGLFDAGILGAVPNFSWAALGVVGLFVVAVSAEGAAQRSDARSQ